MWTLYTLIYPILGGWKLFRGGKPVILPTAAVSGLRRICNRPHNNERRQLPGITHALRHRVVSCCATIIFQQASEQRASGFREFHRQTAARLASLVHALHIVIVSNLETSSRDLCCKALGAKQLLDLVQSCSCGHGIEVLLGSVHSGEVRQSVQNWSEMFHHPFWCHGPFASNLQQGTQFPWLAMYCALQQAHRRK